MPIINKTTLLLLIVGGLNWGLVGVFDFDLVATLFGEMTVLSTASIHARRRFGALAADPAVHGK